MPDNDQSNDHATLRAREIEEQEEQNLFDEALDIAYENPEFFTLKEISSLVMSQSMGFLKLVVRGRGVTVDDIKKAAELEAINITLSLDNASMERFFEKSRRMVGSESSALMKARRRLGSAIDAAGEEETIAALEAATSIVAGTEPQ